MLNLRKRISLRIPDRVAIAVAMALTVTAAGATLGERWLDAPAEEAATAMPVENESSDPTSDENARPGGLTVGLLLFGHG